MASLTRRTRWAIVGAAVLFTALLVVLLGIVVPLLVWPGDGDDGSCRATAEGIEHRDESRRLGVEVPADQRPDAKLGDPYSSMDGCVTGDDVVR